MKEKKMMDGKLAHQRNRKIDPKSTKTRKERRQELGEGNRQWLIEMSVLLICDQFLCAKWIKEH